ncbi:MAG: hypothetical protein A3C83_01240 [Candidatus Ryanbacteria bacterium RIFCSPHIGHO2_02_FULL_47_25]|nr:MAG: hypothetical protein A3C83_01240 [Candidatus Ryanbacteria bacterium RIFCSPHIGHO2_02_FULL_47_25]
MLRVSRYLLLAALIVVLLLTLQCDSSFEPTSPQLPNDAFSSPQTEQSNFFTLLASKQTTRKVVQNIWLPMYFLLLAVEIIYIQKLNKPRTKSIPFIAVVTIVAFALWELRSFLVCPL